ncbi:MAG: peptidase, M16 family protein [Cyclobacteriaceae bacterium]|nr:peptidase, M16 family protein [Cyclobacteriaceae bacterium]
MKLKLLLIAPFALSISLALAITNIENKPESEASMAVTDPAEVIAKYIKAIGGKENVDKIKNAITVTEAEVQGNKISIRGISDSENGRLLQESSMNGSVLQKVVMANGKAKGSFMGQEEELPDEVAGLLKVQTYVFPEQQYEKLGYTLKADGTETIEGEEAYKLVITSPDGRMTTTEYYSVSSGLKLRTSSDVTGDISYSDYTEIDGVKIPMTLKTKNAMLPEAMITKVVSVKLNQQLSDEDFR